MIIFLSVLSINSFIYLQFIPSFKSSPVFIILTFWLILAFEDIPLIRSWFPLKLKVATFLESLLFLVTDITFLSEEFSSSLLNSNFLSWFEFVIRGLKSGKERDNSLQLK